MSNFEEILKPINQSKHGWVDDAWLGLGDTSNLRFRNPLIKTTPLERENIGLKELKLMRDPEYLYFAARLLLNVELIPMQCAVMEELWTRPFPMMICSRGFSKTFLLAVYSLLKCALYPDQKIIVVGAAFRQSRLVWEYMIKIWDNAPILQSIAVKGTRFGPKREVDRCSFFINSSVTHCIPLGTGEKIRGMRATTILVDEFSSVSPEIYETVVAGFAAVSSDPVTNIKEAARRKEMNKLGIWTADAEKKYQTKGGNQAIISGTASYDFNHFADYWKRYKSIIESKGNLERLKDIVGEDALSDNFNWRDYSIIRIPYELIPEGFMDDRQVIRAKATVHSGVYMTEYSAVFALDSTGFFKRSLIEKCVTSDVEPVVLPSGKIWFDAILRGDEKYKYVIGVDPAVGSDAKTGGDNFSIVVLELRQDHTRIVYCWSTNRKEFKRRLKEGLSDKYDFYGFCSRKIRDLVSAFPCVGIALDTQGGGRAILEALQDPDKMKEGEIAILPVIDDDHPADTDNLPGKHIIHLCQFASSDWTAEANHGLRKDFEDRVLLFPRFDPLSLEISSEDDERRRLAWEKRHPGKKFNIYDTLEDCVMEIEELKNELCTIVQTRTGTGVQARDRWDTPETKLPNGRKGRLRKDRYSALVMANMIARNIQRYVPPPEYEVIGGNTKILKGKHASGKLYHGPEWFTKEVNRGFIGRAISK